MPFARNNSEKSSSNLQIGLAYAAQGLYLQADAQYTMALNLIEKSNDNGRGVIFNNLAIFYRKLGEYDKAIEYTEKLLSIAEKIDDKDLLGKAYMSLGNCCFLKENSRLASDYFQRRLNLAIEEKDKNGQLVAYGSLGNCYQSENPFKAIEYYEKQLKLHSKTDNTAELGKCYLNLGAAYNRLEQYEEGISYYSKSLKNAEERGDLELQATAHNNLAVAFENISNFEQAEKNYLKSISLLSQIQSELKENVQWKITIYEQQASTYRKFERFLKKRERIEKALEIADLRRSRALVSVLSKKMPTETLTSDPLKIHQIQELAIKLKTSFAIYSLATDEDENTGVWIVPPHGDIVWQPLSIADEIKNKHKISNSFPYVVSPPKMEMTEEPSFEDQFNEQLAKWYDVFIRPIELYLPKDPQQTVTIIAEEFLSMLPIAAFRDKKGKYLIEKHPISIAPSIAVLNLLSQLPKSANETSLIVGHPTTPNPHDNDLEFAEKQVMRIVAPLLNTSKHRILTKTAPTANRVVKEAINARWIHLSCHGTLGNTIEEKPDLYSVFEGLFKLVADKDHPKGYLQAKEVAFLNLKADLVFMNACFSGRGKLQQEGTIGPVWSFLAAGARSTIGTYWGLLDTEITNQMVEIFYKHLLGKGVEKLNKAQALQKAMLCGIKKDRDNPRQWAAFFLSGLVD